MTRAFILLSFLALLLPAPAFSIDADDLLPVEEAFALEVRPSGPDALSVSFEIADGYYLYRGRTALESRSDGIALGAFELPAGEEKVDEFFGRVQSWRGRVAFRVPLRREAGAGDRLELAVKSQGCADLGVCYPPQRQLLSLDLPPPSGTATPLGLGAGGGGLFAAEEALPVDEAFRFEAIALSATELLARWTIAPGYYLYREQLAFELPQGSGVRIAAVERPPGEPMVDEHFGDVEVYFTAVEVPLRLERDAAPAGPLALSALFQGCKEAGICYPPAERTVILDLPALPAGTAPTPPSPAAEAGEGTAAATGGPPEPEQDRLARALADDALWTLLSFFGFGLLLAFTPCVFPMVPILSGIIAGQGEAISTRRAFVLSLVYVLAMALTYTLAGVVAGYSGYNLQAAFQNAWVLGAFSFVFVLLALSMFGFYELQLPSGLQSRLNSLSNRQQGGTLAGVAVMGFLSALIVGPCVAPPLAAALIYIGQTGDPVLGGAALFALSLGMGTPLVAVGTSAGRFLPQAGAWMDAVKAVFGVALLALAIWMLERIVPPVLVMLLWGALAIASGVYLGALERLPEGASGWRRLWKSLGVVLLVLGALELIGAAAGGRDWMQPLKAIGGGGPASASARPEFRPVKSVADLEAALAGHSGPAMLDFYADWCVDCKRMDRYTFGEAQVAQALAGGLALKADVTANDAVDQALLRRFGIIGPPAILFFDAAGRELPGFRVVGFQRAEPFAEHVRLAFAAGRAP